MNLFSWLKNDGTSLKIIFSNKDSVLSSTFQKIVDDVPSNKHILIIDNKHTWTSQQLNLRSKILLPKSKEELLSILSELHEFVHPRLGLIIIDHLPFYYRDFMGRQAKEVAINLRSYSASLAILQKLINEDLLIVLGTYTNYQNREIPIYNNANKHYNLSNIKANQINSNKIEMNIGAETICFQIEIS